MEHYEYRGIVHDWFSVILEIESMFYNGIKSDLKNIICGVPQGSILGPLLFIFYLSVTLLPGITKTSTLLDFILFADDTPIILYSSDDIHDN